MRLNLARLVASSTENLAFPNRIRGARRQRPLKAHVLDRRISVGSCLLIALPRECADDHKHFSGVWRGRHERNDYRDRIRSNARIQYPEFQRSCSDANQLERHEHRSAHTRDSDNGQCNRHHRRDQQ